MSKAKLIDNPRVIFSGRIHPERSYLTINLPPDFRIGFEGADAIGEIELSISVGQINAVFHSESAVENIFSIKNATEDCVRTLVDSYGYANGCGYDVEIVSGYHLDKNKHKVFGVGIPSLMERDNKKFVDLFLVLLKAREASDYLRRTLADLREAIRCPKDTGEFCYRGIEAIRKYFALKYSLDDNNRSDCNKAWTKMREHLDIKRDDIDFVGQFAVDVRHGGSKLISDEERSKIFLITWQIVDAFIDYLSKEFSIDNNELIGK